jgi:hypothetical protein
MITVEKVIKKNAVESAEIAKDNEELLKTGSIREVKKPIWPWIVAIVVAVGVGWYLLRKKGSGTNEGIPG